MLHDDNCRCEYCREYCIAAAANQMPRHIESHVVPHGFLADVRYLLNELKHEYANADTQAVMRRVRAVVGE